MRFLAFLAVLLELAACASPPPPLSALPLPPASAEAPKVTTPATLAPPAPAPLSPPSPSTLPVSAPNEAVTTPSESPDLALPDLSEAPAIPVAKPAPIAMPWLKLSDWKKLPGWGDDDLRLAWPALLASCKGLKANAAWTTLCRTANSLPPLPENSMLRDFFEQQFQPWQISQPDGGNEGVITGYYEPLLHGSHTLTSDYRYPVYAPPDDLLVVDLSTLYPELKNMRLRGHLQGNKVVPYFTREQIESGQAPVQGKELAWVDDNVELFFLQVQGSGRIRFDNGEVLRIGYADQNGHPYRSIGKWLVEHGELTLDKASMQGIKEWGRRHPERLTELLNANPSYIFFRPLANNQEGPLGALGVPLTAERSLAIDPRSIPLGAPLWLDTTRPNSSEPLQRLMLAQDTGGAIRGNVRADFFWGFGEEAGKQAGAMKQKGRLWVLLPKDFPLSQTGASPRLGLK